MKDRCVNKEGTGAHFDERNLPSEQDRKAILGCLAAALTIMFDHQTSHHHPATASVVKSTDKSKKGVSTSTTTNNNTTTGHNHHDNGSTSSLGVSGARTREFQEELLVTACQLLYLEPTVHSVEFLPILDNRSASSSESLLLDPFLSSLSDAEAGFQCISLLLFRFLLLSHNNMEDCQEKAITTTTCNDAKKKSLKKASKTKQAKTIIGYDSRVRYAFKYVSVSILNFWDPVYGRSCDRGGGIGSTSSTNSSTVSYALTKAGRKHATRKYEALEDAIAHRISVVSHQIIAQSNWQQPSSNKEPHNKETTTASSTSTMKTKKIKRKSQIVRGLKIGTAAIGAGALLAISGGIAVPAIIGGIAAAAGITALSLGTLTAISLLVLPAVVTIFGVGSGVLVAGKMSNRTRGLTNFEIQLAEANETNNNAMNKNQTKGKEPQPQQPLKLARTICINGWIADEHDFERPFGMPPKSLRNRSELLKRFCSVYAPQVIPNCDEILEEWNSNNDELWKMLRDAYGKDPDALYPLEDDISNGNNLLTSDEHKSIDSIMRNIMGIPQDTLQQILGDENNFMNKKDSKNSSSRPLHPVSLLDDVLNSKQKKKNQNSDDDVLKDKKHRSYVAWDFQSTYKGMELYTVSWEQDLLLQLRESAKELTKDLAMKGAEQIIKKTVLATLMSAVAIPSTLLGLTSFIDEKWILANERADEAGILMAESLLMSTAGHRPVNLIGISFGARMIVSCLTELSRHQQKWEKEQQCIQDNKWGKLLKAGGDAIRKSINDSVTSKRGSSNSTNETNQSSASYLREPASIVENVILMGCPATVKPSTWKSMRGMVAGQLVNCHAGNDTMLSLMYRIKNPTTALLNPPVGITQVKECGVTNFDVSDMIDTNHGDYCLVVKDILDRVGFDQPL